jgi:hypothetical protein
MGRLIAGLFLFASMTGPSAVAQAATPVQTHSIAQIDPARMAAAERLLVSMDYDKLMDRTMDALISDAQKSLPQQLEAALKQPLPADLNDKLLALIISSMRRAMAGSRAEMRKGSALIYASRFTAPEIDHLIELQKDPVMVKMLAQLPQITTEGAAMGQAAMEREMPRLKKEIEAMVTDYFRQKS